MRHRINRKMLEIKAHFINTITESPQEYEPGHYYIDGGNGGYTLERVPEDERGGSDDPLNIGHIPARELFGLMGAYIHGLQDA